MVILFLDGFELYADKEKLELFWKTNSIFGKMRKVMDEALTNALITFEAGFKAHEKGLNLEAAKQAFINGWHSEAPAVQEPKEENK